MGTSLYLKIVVTRVDAGWGVYTHIHTAFGDVVSKAHSIVIMSQPFNFSWSGWSTALRSRRHIGRDLVWIHNYICWERMGRMVCEISVHVAAEIRTTGLTTVPSFSRVFPIGECRISISWGPNLMVCDKERCVSIIILMWSKQTLFYNTQLIHTPTTLVHVYDTLLVLKAIYKIINHYSVS